MNDVGSSNKISNTSVNPSKDHASVADQTDSVARSSGISSSCSSNVFAKHNISIKDSWIHYLQWITLVFYKSFPCTEDQQKNCRMR